MISAALLKLIEHQGKLVFALSQQAIEMLSRLWIPYRDWTDYDKTLGQAARSATTVEAASRQARARERMYLKFIYKELGLNFPKQEEIETDGGLTIAGGVDVYMRQGVTPLEVYQRPAEEYRYHISTGLSEPEALQKTIERVGTLADTDLSLTRRDEARRVFRSSGDQIIGYRRIIHPEQSEDGTSCGLCVVASQRIYHTNDLLPIHDRCNCDIMPITAKDDPGKLLNDMDLQRIYEAAQSNEAGDLLKTKVSFLEHGELGPILAGGNRSRPGAKQRRAKGLEPITPLDSVNAQIHSLEKSSANLLKRQAKGEDVREALNWQRDRLIELRRQLVILRRK
jgi:hypothetical protein